MAELAKLLGLPLAAVTGAAMAIAFLGRELWKRIQAREAELKEENRQLKAELSKTSAALLALHERLSGKPSSPA